MGSQSWVKRRDELARLAREHAGWGSGVVLVTKDSWFWDLLGTVLGWLGLMSRETFLTKFATTLGGVVALPREMSYGTARRLLAHEVGGHVRHCRWFGLFVPWIGTWLGFLVVVVLQLLLPIGFNWFRYRMELHADSVMWRWMLKEGGATGFEIGNRAASFGATVGSWKYGHPVWRRWALWGFKRKAKRVIARGVG
jgi:hypothetical protein